MYEMKEALHTSQNLNLLFTQVVSTQKGKTLQTVITFSPHKFLGSFRIFIKNGIPSVTNRSTVQVRAKTIALRPPG